MLRALGAVAISTLRPPGAGESRPQPRCPTRWIEREVTAPPAALVRDFVKDAGGDPSSYREELPFHLFPQWGLALASQAVSEAAYPMARVMNAGCAVEVHHPLPAGEPLLVKARLESIDDDGSRAILTQRLVTGTRSVPEAITASIRAFVPLAARGDGPKKAGGPAPLVPANAREIAFMRVRPSAGLDFAILTGDFNPVHWARPYARAAGFRAPILHGFATFSRTVEALHRRLFSGDVHALSKIDVRFTRPLALPASVGVYVLDDRVFVGDAPGGVAYLTGTFSRASGGPSA
jgi:acyl dehydratase